MVGLPSQEILHILHKAEVRLKRDLTQDELESGTVLIAQDFERDSDEEVCIISALQNDL